ncbi:putative LRR receptor-like serine/threonine-protein kinase [Senna tora]|uniref:non-specific serine/threonine protein kinase n=1 Tax=Senna tora TaxID=362788 RepID=A0A834T2R5_9FABA|nr:putative LRR receptor-like serine/threonine-protein kinase [Senna tora]
MAWSHMQPQASKSHSVEAARISPHVGNLSFLRNLSLDNNYFHGEIPTELGRLFRLKSLNLSFNAFTGEIPINLTRCTQLRYFELSQNVLNNIIPFEIGSLTKLETLYLFKMNFSMWNLSSLETLSVAYNNLEGSIQEEIRHLKNLGFLFIGANKFSGALPLSLYNMSSLKLITAAWNQLNVTKLPHNMFSTLFNLQTFGIGVNQIAGTIPTSFGKLHQLQLINLGANQLNGEIPSSLGNLSDLVELYFSKNKLEGKIPPIFGEWKYLTSLDLSKNNLIGAIPLQIFSLFSLSKSLNLSHNSLNGSLPIEVGKLKNLDTLDISENHLCDEIPQTIGECITMEYLYLQGNRLSRTMPPSLASLKNLMYLDLSRNNLSGSIPMGLQNISVLEYLNVSFNLLEGEVPIEGVSRNACGISMTGSGSFVTVCKGRLESENKFVAVKVLNLQKKGAHKSFISECNALKNVRHRNLVKILTCCSSIDYKGLEFKALVFEYMSNGSLENWLHPSSKSVEQPRTLDLDRRLNVLCDVASALHYLHHECEQPIMHCDLKPSNILLDEDMFVHVSDFGLARLVSTLNGFSKLQTSTSGIKGTIGYAPPEYGIGSEISTQGDVYSFGILVLEMLTGRRPIEEMFKDGLNLHSYVKAVYPNNLWDILDSALLLIQIQENETSANEEISMEEPIFKHPNEEKAILSLFEIELACSFINPINGFCSHVTSILVHPPSYFLLNPTMNTSNHFCNWHGVTCGRKHQRVTELKLQGYGLRGTISPHVGNLSFLRNLSLNSNNIHGEIPAELGRLFRLKNLNLLDNAFTGAIPINLTACTQLRYFDLLINKLIGIIPNELGSLRKLEKLYLHKNNLIGHIPASMWNLSSLDTLFMGDNNFQGSIPKEVSQLKTLRVLSIVMNKFSGALPSSLYNMSSHTYISAALNQLNSTRLPNNMFSTLFNLRVFSIGGNQVVGSIPTSITNASSLQILDISENYFVGKVPSLGNLKYLQWLNLEFNNLGSSSNSDLDFITSLGNSSKLETLTLDGNNFGGILSNSIANLSAQLTYLYLGGNQLYGRIPSTLQNYTNLIGLGLEFNQFTGTLKSLGTLDISKNDLSGEIPRTIGECTSMEYLYLQGNLFNGIMPSSLASLKGLIHLDLSQNNLSGSIPTCLQNISVLEYLNVSFNMLDGEVPTEGVFRNASAISVAGNNKLCGGIPKLHLSPCPIKFNKQSKHHNLKFIVIIICVVVCVCLLLSSILAIYLRRKRNKTSSSTSPTIDQLAMVSYQNLHNATEGFSIVNLIEPGSFGLVYKGRIESEDKFVAIKVLNLQKKGAHKSFISECNALKNIRHRNLIKILTCCSSIDYKGQEFKALVFEYMSNGSLEEWLYIDSESLDQPGTLDLDRIFNILCDVAFGLHYLHYECEQPVIHCDLKPSNILLDDDMVSHVSDFGNTCMSEYGTGSEVLTQGDVYSFGILVLEMLIGRGPTYHIFKDGHDLHSYVRIAYPNNLLKIVDSALLRKQTQQPTTAVGEEIIVDELIPMHPNEEKAVFSLFGIGLACSVESPKERQNMMEVTRELNQIRNVFHSRQ